MIPALSPCMIALIFGARRSSKMILIQFLSVHHKVSVISSGTLSIYKNYDRSGPQVMPTRRVAGKDYGPAKKIENLRLSDYMRTAYMSDADDSEFFEFNS